MYESIAVYRYIHTIYRDFRHAPIEPDFSSLFELNTGNAEHIGDAKQYWVPLKESFSQSTEVQAGRKGL